MDECGGTPCQPTKDAHALVPQTWSRQVGPRLGPVASRSGAPTCFSPPLSRNPVPAAHKGFEFDGVICPTSEDAPQPDLACSISAMAETLSSGSDEQRTLVLFEVQQLLPHCAELAVQSIVPIVCENVTSWSSELQNSAAETLLVVVANPIPPELSKTISLASFRVLTSTSNVNMHDVWGDILVSTLPHAKWSLDELDNALFVLDSRRDLNMTLLHRRLTARILGSFAVWLTEEQIKRHILKRAVSLSSDDSVDIRGMIAESFAHIGAAVGIETVESELWTSILRLVDDGDARVHAAAMRSLAHIANRQREKNLSCSFFKKLLPALFLRECIDVRKAAQEDQRLIHDDRYLILEINAYVFGQFVTCCFKELSDDSARKEVYKTFVAMSTCNGPVVRRHCAFNMPGVAAQFVNRYRNEVGSLVEFLSGDSDAETRWNLAAGLHETVRILLSRDTIDCLFNTAETLLGDSNTLVRLNVLQHFDELLSELAKHKAYASSSRLTPLFENLQVLCQGNWRTQELLAKQLRLAAPLVPPPTIRSNILPLLYKITEQSSYLVRKACMAAVGTCMRYLSDTQGREHAMSAFRAEWANSPIYWKRMGFIDAAETAIETYSRILFRDTFGAALLRLAHDRVSNVRLRAAKLLHKAAAACHQMEEFYTAMEALKTDHDVDVQYEIRDLNQRVSTVLEEAKGSFEEDMRREEEEQELYARHLQAQRNANKKRNPVKRTTSLLLGKAKGLAGSPTRTVNTPDFPTQTPGTHPRDDVSCDPFAGRTGGGSPGRICASAPASPPEKLHAKSIKGLSSPKTPKGLFPSPRKAVRLSPGPSNPTGPASDLEERVSTASRGKHRPKFLGIVASRPLAGGLKTTKGKRHPDSSSES